MLPICYLFFMSLSAGVALLQPSGFCATDQLVKPEESSLEATDQLVKPEERPLEVTDQLVKPEESELEATKKAPENPPLGLLKEQEKKQKQKETKEPAQVNAQPAGPSGFGYTMASLISNLIKLADVYLLSGLTFVVLLSVLHHEHLSHSEKKNPLPTLLPILIESVNTENISKEKRHEESLVQSFMVVAFYSFVINSFSKLCFYFFKGYVWFKRHSTAFMVGLQQLLLVIISCTFQLLEEKTIFSIETVNCFNWFSSFYLWLLLFDLSISSLLQKTPRSLSLFG